MCAKGRSASSVTDAGNLGAARRSIGAVIAVPSLRPLASRWAALASLLVLPAAPAAHADSAPLQRGAPAAAFGGLWCGTGLLHEFSLELTQQQREVQGTLVRRERRRELEGHVEGSTLVTQATKLGSLVLQRAGDELRVTQGDGLLAMARGATFQRANGAACTG